MTVQTPRRPTIHETAVVHATARLDGTCTIGPYSIVGPNVEIGTDVIIDSHVLVARDTTVAAGCRIHHGAVLGTDPQDLKYAGEPSRLEVGQRTVVREYATLNRGTGEGGITRIGRDCLLMAYSHVAHDCVIGNGVILANSVNLAGHIVIGERAIVGGLVGVHQFVRIGRHAFIGGCSGIRQDIPPFLIAAGMPARPRGVNVVGLKRAGFDAGAIQALKRAFRTVFASGKHLGAALEEVESLVEATDEVKDLVRFIRASERGVAT